MRDSGIVPVLLLLCLVAILAAGYFFFLNKEDYPVERLITNREGKTIEVLIQGKTGGYLHFDRMPEKRRYQIPLRDLSWSDRIFAFRLREEAPPPVVVKTVKKETDPYILNRIRKIDELEKKRLVIESEIASETLSELLHRKRQDQLKELENDIKELEVAIETYKWRIKK